MIKYKGKVWTFGDNIDTDEIIPGPYLTISDPEEMGLHCMEGIEPKFKDKITAGDILVAGNNFGCGSSREQAPLAIKASGIAAVVALSFSRLFYRNAINIGLPIFECSGASLIREGDLIEIDPDSGEVFDTNLNRGFKSGSFPPFIQELIKSGGIINYINSKQK